MTAEDETARQRLRGLSGSARRLLDYVAVLEDGARYELLRRLARAPEPDMIEDLREVVEAGILAALPGRPNTYDFVDENVRALVLADAGEARLPKLRARAEAARQRSEGGASPPSER
jgi:hypothetical protein